jgi:hypothetical protein
VRLVAVGLNFDRKTSFRSRVIVLYGRPFSIGTFAADQDDLAAVRLATEQIAAEMRRVLVEADPQSDAAMVARVERLYSAARGRPQGALERVARRRSIARGMEQLRVRDQARFEEIALRLRRYDQRLHRFGLRDRHLDLEVSRRTAAWFALREAIAALVLGPIAVAGFVLFWVPYHLTALLAGRATRERDVAATAKVFVGAAVYVAWLLVIAAVAWQAGGARAGVVTAAALPPIAVVALFAIERETAVIDTVRSWWMLRRAKAGTKARLRDARSELADVLDETYEWLNAERPSPADAKMPN